MLATVYSGAVYGVDAYSVEIEVNAGHGDPQTVIVGLPDAAVKESKDRVHTAIVNSGYKPHIGRTTINLAPADIKKEGPIFDLPIAIGMLAAQEEIKTEILDRFAFVGELALSGEVRRAKGVLPITMCARKDGRHGIIVPADNAEEAGVVEGIDVYPVRTLRQTAEFLEGSNEERPFRVDLDRVFRDLLDHEDDYADVKGQEQAKRAIEIAVAGGHNMLMIGPPGTGKTMLAKRMPSILPEMTLQEALEATRIHSVAGTLPSHAALIGRRPFRSPHHTISDAGLLGGGAHPIPGEVSLAHHGVLFLDELPEFKRSVLEVLRQPLEDGHVTISRAAVSLEYPAQFLLIASSNPCPCGYFGNGSQRCTCTPATIQRYMSRLSGPLLDRIDLHINVPAVPYKELAADPTGETSATIRDRVNRARTVQAKRFEARKGVFCNARMNSRDLRQFCHVDDKGHELLQTAIQRMGLSARAYDRILKVSRTIADLEQNEHVTARHVAEAVQYRSLDRQQWMR